jgi:hypothetical protein
MNKTQLATSARLQIALVLTAKHWATSPHTGQQTQSGGSNDIDLWVTHWWMQECWLHNVGSGLFNHP